MRVKYSRNSVWIQRCLGNTGSNIFTSGLNSEKQSVSHDAYICFIDFSKAFDKVKHDKMIEILRITGIDEKDIRIIVNILGTISSGEGR